MLFGRIRFSLWSKEETDQNTPKLNQSASLPPAALSAVTENDREPICAWSMQRDFLEAGGEVPIEKHTCSFLCNRSPLQKFTLSTKKPASNVSNYITTIHLMYLTTFFLKEWSWGLVCLISIILLLSLRHDEKLRPGLHTTAHTQKAGQPVICDP